MSRVVRRQFATLVAYRATSGGIAPRGKPRSSSSQCSTLSSCLNTSTLLSSRHHVSSSGGSTSSRLSSFHSHSSTSRRVLRLSGVGRRHSFLPEGPNGVVVRVEKRWLRNHPPSTEDVTYRGVAMMSRPARLPRHRRSAQFPSAVYISPSPGARHLRACPVREVVTVTWDAHPWDPVEGVLRATSVLKLAATRRALELSGKWWTQVEDKTSVDAPDLAGRTPGGGEGAVVGVAVASSGSPVSVYVTLE
ncbi:hypothetical protein Taro_038896, partial [Colocasia esculenta]|nr:hypothetical protein [Colocasia esculenta]